MIMQKDNFFIDQLSFMNKTKSNNESNSRRQMKLALFGGIEWIEWFDLGCLLHKEKVIFLFNYGVVSYEFLPQP
eukprot:UN03468